MNFGDKSDRKVLARWVVGVAAACTLIYLGIRYVSVIAMAVRWLFDLFLPLLAGLLIAVVLNIPMSMLEGRLFRRKVTPLRERARRPLAIVASLLLVFGALVLVVALIVPEMAKVAGVVIESLARALAQMTELEGSIDWTLVPFGEELSRIDVDWDVLADEIEKLAVQVGAAVEGAAGSAVGDVVDVVANVSLGLVFAVYALQSKERICAQFTRLARAWLPERAAVRAFHVVDVCYNTFRLFIVGQATEALVLGALCTLGMLVLGLPYAVMIGALVCVTAMIPYIGGLIGGAVGAFMILSVDPFEALVFLVFLVVLQQIEGNLIYPKVVGARVSLPSVWVFAAVTIGGKLAGPAGMLLGVPAAAAAYALLREGTGRREAALAEAD